MREIKIHSFVRTTEASGAMSQDSSASVNHASQDASQDDGIELTAFNARAQCLEHYSPNRREVSQ